MKEFFPGDLVRYIGKVVPVELKAPVIPPNKRPYGMVLEVKEFKLGGDPLCAATMHVIMVNWFEAAWNTSGDSHSEEIISDLELVQRGQPD
jgi:hypothetical protein